MRPLATFCLILGAADLVAIDVVIGPAAIAERDPGARGARGRGETSAPATPPVAASAPSPMPVERVEPDLPPPRPLAVAAADPPAAAPAPARREEPAAEPDPEPHPGSVPALVILHFGFDSDQLGRSSRARLDRVAEILEERGDLAVGIDGHADESGSEEHNQTLSERRAQRVAEYLQERGIEASRLTVNAFGELQPLDPERPRERDRRNRRVELRFGSQKATGDTE